MADKEYKDGNLQLVWQIQYPELKYYGLRSGEIGLSKSKSYHIANSSNLSHFGYDKENSCSISFFYFLT